MNKLSRYVLEILTTTTLIFGGVENKKEIEFHEIYSPFPYETHEVEATFYTSKCKGCTGFTKYKSHDVRNTVYFEGLRVIAVDPNLIKLGSIVNVELENGYYFKAIAADIGGDIKNLRIDVLVANKKQAYELGRQNAKVTIIE